MSISKYHVSPNMFNISEQNLTSGGVVQLVDLGEDKTYNALTIALQFNNANAQYANQAFIDLQKDNGTHKYISLSNLKNSDTDVNYVTDQSVSGDYYVTYSESVTFRYIYIYRYSGAYSRFSSGTAKIAVYNDTTTKHYDAYGERFIDWFYREYGTETETFTTLPHEVIGDGTAISAWSLKGNMTQSGTPTPSNPIYPSECGEKTANLLNITEKSYQFSFNNATANVKGCNITFTGSCGVEISRNNATWKNNNDFWLDAGTYTIKLGEERVYQSGYASYLIKYDDDTNIGSMQTQLNVITFTIDERTHFYIGFYIYNKNFGDGDSWIFMLNEGSTALPYEPSDMYKIPILSNGNTYPIYLSEPIRKIGDYADTINSDGTVTRNIYKLIWTGAETGWRSVSGVCFNQEITPDYLRVPNKNTLICTHYKSINQVSSASAVGDGQCSLYNTGGSQRMYFKDVNISSTDAFMQYLADQYAAGTPITVWYVLATATTESFTPVTIPTSGTAQTFDVDTTLKPSEVSLTYHGWHDHTDTKYTSG